MNEFGAKKLGEVMAFSKMGKDFFTLGEKGFLKIFSKEEIEDIKNRFDAQGTEVLKIATEKGVKEICIKKAMATSQKIKTMGDLYIKDEWDNHIELCEWFGFFEGAAVVHWTLVKGLAEGLQNKSLESLADRAISFNEDLLKHSAIVLFNNGKEKSI